MPQGADQRLLVAQLRVLHSEAVDAVGEPHKPSGGGVLGVFVHEVWVGA